MLKSPVSRSGSDSQLVRHVSQEEFEHAAVAACQEGKVEQLENLFANYFYFVVQETEDFFDALLNLCLKTNNSSTFSFLIKYLPPQGRDLLFKKTIETKATNILAFFLRNIDEYTVSTAVLGKVLEETAGWQDKSVFAILISQECYPAEVLTAFLETAIINADTVLLTLLLDRLKARNAVLSEIRFLAFLEDCRNENDEQGFPLIAENSYNFMKNMLESFNDSSVTERIKRLSLASLKI